MTNTTHRIQVGWFFTVIGCLAAAAAPQTSSTTRAMSSPMVTTTQLSGIVKYTEGNTLVASMSTGELETFNVPDTTRFVIDGRDVALHELRPGTYLTATIVTTTTPVVERTTTNLIGRVWFVLGNTVILTLPDGKNHMYTAEPHYKFKVDGRDAEVSDLRKGMRISAERIVEAPITEIARNTTVVGTAPRP